MKRNTAFKIIIELVLIIILGVLFAIRVQYGFDQTDESHYYALAKRFSQGDIPFIDEWHPSQFFAVLLYPLYDLYTVFVPSGDGVILAGRYFYLGMQMVVCIYILWSFRAEKYRLIYAVLYLMCSRQNIPGLSYYNLFMTFCLVATISVMNYVKDNRQLFYMVLVGISVSAATVCMPFFAMGVFLFVMCLLFKKRIKEAAVLSLSIVVCAMVYIGCLLSKASLPEYISAFSYVMSSPDHTGIISLDKIVGTILSVGKVCVLGVPGFLYLMVRLRNIFRKENYDADFGRNEYIVFLTSLLLCIAVSGIVKPGAIYIQVTFLSFPFVLKNLLAKSHKSNLEKRKMIIMYFTGIIIAFLFWLGSNTEATCLPLGLIISVMASCLIFAEEISEDRKVLAIIYISIAFAAISSRIAGPCFRDEKPWKLDTVLVEGPAKGIYTEKADAEDYYKVLELIDVIEAYKTDSESKVLFSRFLPWAYLACDLRNGAETTWETPISSKRLIEYYEHNPSKFPDVVVILDSQIGRPNGLDGGGIMNRNNELKGEIWDRLENCLCEEFEAGKVFFTVE